MTMIRSSTLVAMMLVVAIVGCGGGVEGQPDDGVLQVTMRDYHFDPDQWTIRAGEEVRIVLTNEDDAAHDVSIGRDVVVEDQRPLGYSQDLLANLDFEVSPAHARSRSVSGPPSVLVTVAPASTVTLTFTPAAEYAGEWEIGCFHSVGCQYNAGLQGTLAITGS
jgi:plastocyanin